MALHQRLPTATQKDCHGGLTEFTGKTKGEFEVVQTCHVGSLTGKLKTYDTSGKIVPGTANAKFELSFFGGVRKQEYWVIDRDDGLGWAVMGTPGGNYVWLLARNPGLDAASRQAAAVSTPSRSPNRGGRAEKAGPSQASSAGAKRPEPKGRGPEHQERRCWSSQKSPGACLTNAGQYQRGVNVPGPWYARPARDR